MDKRKLTYWIIFFLSFNIILADQSPIGKRKKKLEGNVNQFVLAPFSYSVHMDSIKIISFIEIPFFSLQFVKLDNKYRASYEASIALQDKKGTEIGHYIWSDSIIVNSYSETKTLIKNRKHYATFTVPKNEFKLLGELQDSDTRKRGTQIQKLNFKKFKNNISLLDPIYLLSMNGNWGFRKNLIPTRGNRVREIGPGINLLVSGFVISKSFKITVWVGDTKTDKNFIKTIIEDGQNGFFTKYIFIESNKLESLKNIIQIELEQDGKILKKDVVFSTYKPGVSNYVEDLDRALKQMRYILTNDERKQIKNKNRKQKKELFYSLWKDRDPTPKTEFNELMEEYYGRIWYANEHFNAWAPGWETDMGMIYILFGPPDEIQKSNPAASNPAIYQIWHYYRISKEFIFKDQNGFGDYRLDTPFLGVGF